MTAGTLWVVLGLVAVALVVPAGPAGAVTERPVLTTPAGEFQPARSENALAWEQNTRARPNKYVVNLRPDGAPAVQANRPGTTAAMGDFSGGRLIYQEYRGNPHKRGRSDLFFYDIASGTRSRVPGVNRRLWEYWPSSSGSWLLFARWKPKNDVRRLFLYNLDTGERRLLERTQGEKAFLGPGQVNGNFAVWSTCLPRCDVFRYDIATGTKQMIDNPGFYQRAPAVTRGGTVYFSRGGKGCGVSVALVRAEKDGSQEVLVQLQQGLDIRDTYAYAEPNGVTEIYYERNACRTKAGSDIYKVLDPELASLTVTLGGTGTGTVTSTPPGIDCGTDCAQDYPAGTTVSLHAEADLGSYFAAWSGGCTGTGDCVLPMDGLRSVTATFHLAGSITIVKDALPNNGQDFQFTTTGGLSPSSFSLDDDADPGLPGQQVFTALRAGVYSVQEGTSPTGWQIADVTCVDDGGNTTTGTNTAFIGLDPGENVTCTFINAMDGSITVRKDAVPDDPQDFEFDPSTNLQSTNFFLDDDPGSSRPESATFPNRPVPGTYTVNEVDIPGGWDLTDIECIGGGGDTTTSGAAATIGLDAGEAVVCTFENTKRASITVVKDALPNHPQDFGFTTSGGLTPASFSLDDDGDPMLPSQLQFSNLVPGAYSVIEDADPAGWQLTDLTCIGGGGNTSTVGATATIGLDPGENVMCTFENTMLGSITILKDAAPDDPQDFAFSTTGGLSPATFDLDDDPASGLSNQQQFTSQPPGTYTVSEDPDPTGWQLADITCLGGGPNTSVNARTASIGLDPGENVVCTFTDQGIGSITIIKDASPDHPQDFSFTTSGGPPLSSFSLDDDDDPGLSNQQQFFGVAAGSTYTLTEDANPTGWQLTGIICTGGGLNTSASGRTATIGLDPGENVACTFENSKLGSITIVKDAVPDNPQDFEFAPSANLDASSFFLDDDPLDGTLPNQMAYSDLLPDTYTAEEIVPTLWGVADIACSGGGSNTSGSAATATATIGLDPGEDVVCTFTNTLLP